MSGSSRAPLAGVILCAGGLLAACRAAGVDLEAERGALLDADRAWAAAALARDVQRVFPFWADDAVVFPAGLPAVRGKAAIREFVARNRARPGFSIRWEPREAVVAGDGSLGYTIGDYRVSVEDPVQGTLRRDGTYLETWRKDAEGAWRCTVEIQSPRSSPGGPDLRPGS